MNASFSCTQGRHVITRYRLEAVVQQAKPSRVHARYNLFFFTCASARARTSACASSRSCAPHRSAPACALSAHPAPRCLPALHQPLRWRELRPVVGQLLCMPGRVRSHMLLMLRRDPQPRRRHWARRRSALRPLRPAANPGRLRRGVWGLFLSSRAATLSNQCCSPSQRQLHRHLVSSPLSVQRAPRVRRCPHRRAQPLLVPLELWVRHAEVER